MAVAPSKLESRRHRDRRESVLGVPLDSETRATINHKLKEQNMRTTSAKNPSWWTDENDSAWERTKAALKRDWDQTKHDLGGDEPDTDQNVDNTVRQASGRESIPPRGETAYDEIEPAHRFGYGARSYYQEEYPEWDDELETQLRSDWKEIHPEREANWDNDIEAIRYGWDYDEDR